MAEEGSVRLLSSSLGRRLLEMISAVIIAKNEEKMIADCLETLHWADEILVIDTGSIDKTVDICKKAGARVVKYLSGKTFSDWRNKGLQEAHCDWIVYIDADERVTPDLANEIKKEAVIGNLVAYAIPRKNIILSKLLTHGGWYPDYQKRLFKKKNLRKWVGAVHEEPEFEGELGHLKFPLTHIKHETIPEMVEKTNRWSEIEAKLMFDTGHPPMNIARFASAMWREFWYRMIVKMAFLDGTIGIIFAMYQVFSRFVSYAKLWEMQINKNKI